MARLNAAESHTPWCHLFCGKFFVSSSWRLGVSRSLTGGRAALAAFSMLPFSTQPVLTVNSKQLGCRHAADAGVSDSGRTEINSQSS